MSCTHLCWYKRIGWIDTVWALFIFSEVLDIILICCHEIVLTKLTKISEHGDIAKKETWQDKKHKQSVIHVLNKPPC